VSRVVENFNLTALTGFFFNSWMSFLGIIVWSAGQKICITNSTLALLMSYKLFSPKEDPTHDHCIRLTGAACLLSHWCYCRRCKHF